MTTPSSEDVPVTGTGRVCGESASSAPRVTTISTPSSWQTPRISSANGFQRMFGSMPRMSTTSRPTSGSRAKETRVVGQVTSRRPSSPTETVGRLTW